MVSKIMRRVIRLSVLVVCAFPGLQAVETVSDTAATWRTYENGVGGTGHIALLNGNSMQLNTDSKVRTLTVGPYQAVTVDRGEAFFRVGISPTHVIVEGLSVSGVNTTFNVRDYGGGDVDIVALDGPARLEFLPEKHAASLGGALHIARIMTAGQVAAVRGNQCTLRSPGLANILRSLTWRFGVLEFVNEPIQDIAAEFNRYSRTQLVINDDSIRHLRVGGRFSAFEPESFAATASKVFGLRVEKYPTSSGAVIRLELTSRGFDASAAPAGRNEQPSMLSRSHVNHE
jgi:transmembrane sensor